MTATLTPVSDGTPEQLQTPPPSDSITNVNNFKNPHIAKKDTKVNILEKTIKTGRLKRKVYSFRLDPLVADSFQEWVIEQDLSSCHVIEPFLIACQEGEASSPSHHIHIENFNVDRQVTRLRRKKAIVNGILCERTGKIQDEGICKIDCAWGGSRYKNPRDGLNNKIVKESCMTYRKRFLSL